MSTRPLRARSDSPTTELAHSGCSIWWRSYRRRCGAATSSRPVKCGTRTPSPPGWSRAAESMPSRSSPLPADARRDGVRDSSLRGDRTCNCDTRLHAEARPAQSNACAGSTNRLAGASTRAVSREPCSPLLREGAAVESATPSWSEIQLRIAPESAPSARITERSITIPPEVCGRAKRFTRTPIASVVTRSSLPPTRTGSPRQRAR
jgi:hypothetical protein